MKQSIYILSNVNLEMLPTLKLPGNVESQFNWIHDGFETLLPQILSDQPRFLSQEDAIIWIHFDPNGIKGETKKEEPLHQSQTIDNQLLSIIHKLNDWLSKLPDLPFIISDSLFRNQSASVIEQAESILRKHTNAFQFAFCKWVAAHSQQSRFDQRLWDIAKIPYSLDFQRLLKQELEIAAWNQQNKPKKVLLLDFDRTLWPGTLDEVGESNSATDLSTENQSHFAHFQHKILELKNCGVLLVLVSKNEKVRLKSYFDNNNWMSLQWEDFVFQSVNWNDKSINILELEKALSISIESMLFIDDDARERYAAQQALPSLTVVDFPKNSADLGEWMSNYISPMFFTNDSITEEDLLRSQSYRKRAQRDQQSHHFSNYEDFINSLSIQLTLAPARDKHHSRIIQLSERTNQFNLNGQIIGINELQALEDRPRTYSCIAHYKDHFADEGIIGYLRFEINADDTLTFTHYYLSCRILEKRVEHALLVAATSEIQRINPAIEKLTVNFHDTGRNQRIHEFLDQTGLLSQNTGITDLLKILKKLCLYECKYDFEGYY